MEEGYLKKIAERIYQHIKEIDYDKTQRFKAFKLDMLSNLPRFISSSCEQYEKNKKALQNVDIKNGHESIYSDYLLKLKEELIRLLALEKDPNGLEKIKHDIEFELAIFLNPRTYDENIKALREVQKKQNKTLTKTIGSIDNPRGWC